MRRFITLLGPLALAACSSGYVPAQSPRVAMIMSGGSTTFYKNGVEYPAGILLDGVEDAVAGNPRAEDEARTAHHLMIGGFVCEIAGIGGLAGGTALAASTAPHDSVSAAGLALLAGGVVAEIVSIVLFLNAPPHMYDAVNIYNDGLPPLLAGPSAPAPGAPAPFVGAPLPAGPAPAPATR